MPGAPPFCLTRFSAANRFGRAITCSHTPIRSHSLPRTLPPLAPGTSRPSARSLAASPLPPARQVPYSGFSAFFVRPTSYSSSCPPVRSALPARFGSGTMASADSCHLNPASRPGLPSQTAWRQVSPGKCSGFPRTLASFAASALTYSGLRCFWPARPADTASYEVRLPQVAGLPPASSRPHLTVTPLPSASGWPSSTSAGVSHSLVNAHAGRTKTRGQLSLPSARTGLSEWILFLSPRNPCPGATNDAHDNPLLSSTRSWCTPGAITDSGT
jgi:hypothetical protein